MKTSKICRMSTISSFRERVNNFVNRRLSDVTIGSISLICKAAALPVKVTVYNGQTLYDLVEKRPKGLPLITVSNHISTIDDPVVFGIIMPQRACFQSKLARWTLGAKEIMFTNRFDSFFFSNGKVIPVVRGDGLNQPGVHTAIEKLNKGEWVHLFPEGKVNQSGKLLPRLKWGVGKLVYSANEVPLVLPFVIDGLDKAMPLGTNIPKLCGQRLDVYVGNPMDFTETLRSHREKQTTEPNILIDITKQIHDELERMETSLKSWRKYWD